jgi:pimeloyl-ACP methyl ester carboxylesterase
MAPGEGVATPVQRLLLTTDGVRIAAQLHRVTRSDGGEVPVGLVVAHGFSAHTARENNRRIVARLAQRLPVVAFDFRGHGRSSGVCTLGDREIWDVDAAVRWARTLGWHRVVTVGFSMGAAVVVRHAGLVGGVAGAVAVSGPAFWNYRGTSVMRRLHFGVENRLGRLVVRHWMGTRVIDPPWPQPWPASPEEAAAAIAPTPFLVVHGHSDGFFPLEHPRALVRAAERGAAARGLTQWRAQLWLEDFGHAEVAVGEAICDRIADWALTVAGVPDAGSRCSSR